MHKFKIGDRVKCIAVPINCLGHLRVGAIYTVMYLGTSTDIPNERHPGIGTDRCESGLACNYASGISFFPEQCFDFEYRALEVVQATPAEAHAAMALPSPEDVASFFKVANAVP